MKSGILPAPACDEASARPEYLIPISPCECNLALTLDNGQVFHWLQNPVTQIWHGTIGKFPCRLWQDARGIWTDANPALVSHYLALDDPLEEIEQSFPSDSYCQGSMSACRGMRIIRQPVWECLAAFLCSAMKQVAHIREILLTLRRNFGSQCAPGVYTFPEPEVLARCGEAELRACRLGFRAANLHATAERIAAGEICLESLLELPTERAREELIKLPGVGPKIANCVLLFALHRLDVVPVDVWIHRILSRMAGRNLSLMQAERKAARLGPYAGYVQQYLFHHARVHGVLPEPRNSRR